MAATRRCPYHGRDCRDCPWWDQIIWAAEAERDWPW